MPELFIELLTEEMPARYQQRGAQDFMRILTETLQAAGLTSHEGRYYVSPRHLAVVFPFLNAYCDDRTQEKKGPRH